MIKEEEIFDIKINCFDYITLEESISIAIQNKKQIVICYVNFFTVNIAKNDPKFRFIINSYDIIFPDGTGIWLGLKIRGKNIIKKRFNLTDNGLNLLNFFSKNNLSVFMLGGKQDTLEESKVKIQSLIPGLSITGMLHGYTDKSEDEIIEIINKSNPSILMVGLGTPKQEEWIYNNKNKIKSSVIISVGDLFALFAGTKKRGPNFIQFLGLEWMIRLVSNPHKYYKRYLLGIPKYLIYTINEYIRLNKKF